MGFIHKDIAGRILLMPLRGATISDGINSITFLQLEAESSYRISPTTRINDRGQPVTVAYEITATLYIPENNYGRNDWLNYELSRFIGKPVNVSLPLGTAINWANKPSTLTDFNDVLHTKVINASSPEVAAWRHYINTGNGAYITVEIESVELRPRMIIRVTATVKSLSYNRALDDETTTTGNLKVITNITN